TRDAGFCWGMMVEGRRVMWKVVERSRKRERGCRKRWRENRYMHSKATYVFLMPNCEATYVCLLVTVCDEREKVENGSNKRAKISLSDFLDREPCRKLLMIYLN
nr:hypothetical protein [Tanacetum cinerariifolium]